MQFDLPAQAVQLPLVADMHRDYLVALILGCIERWFGSRTSGLVSLALVGLGLILYALM